MTAMLWRHIAPWNYQKDHFPSFSTTFPILLDRFQFEQVRKWSLRRHFNTYFVFSRTTWHLRSHIALPSKTTQTPIFLAFRSYFQSFSTIFHSMKSWNDAFAVILIFTLPFQVDMKPAASYRHLKSLKHQFFRLFDHISNPFRPYFIQPSHETTPPASF